MYGSTWRGRGLPETEEKYKNPRNLCSGSVRQLNNEITAKRNVRLYAFHLVKADGVDFHNSKEEQFQFLESLGFEVVERKLVTESNILEKDLMDFYQNRSYRNVWKRRYGLHFHRSCCKVRRENPWMT